MEDILVSGATEILKKLVGVVSEDIASAWDVKDDLKKLQSTSEMILAVIADAEKRQEKEQLVRLWLRRLKDIAYDADDIIDEFSYEDMHRCYKKNSSKHKVLNLASSSKPPFAFRLKMAKQIKAINKRLEKITQDMGRFQLEFTTHIPDSVSTDQLDRQVTSHVNESEIVGRKNDESQIIKLLTTNTTAAASSVNPNEKVAVISIVGMGGLGKTTLAQLVYKDELVKKVFDLTMWVHVSEFFDIEILLVHIMESITQAKFHKLSNFRVLENIVREKLNGKKYLLVLDDLWNDDAEQWESLKSVLHVGAPGSKILITTRNYQVASIVSGSVPPYNLSQLEDGACWSIIKQKAFAPGGAFDAPEMSDIGKQIAKKCCGLPLAAKFLGSLMHLKNKESDWISIRDDDMWNTPERKRKLISILRLSYNNLPSHLKQCFSYCSIFPKNWEISKETLVHLWMAEGFLKQSSIKSKRSVEDFGRDYFESLAWNSFFHDFKKNDLGDIETCKMHDLVHDLAKDVLGVNELVSLKASKFKDISQVRRLQLQLDEDISSTSLKCLSNASKLRTVFISEGSSLDPFIFSRNDHLRILHEGSSPNFLYPKWRSLSSALRHLRYLRLTSLDLREAVNDQSVSKLYNLETLILSNIYSVQNILTNIHSLQKLRYLELSSTDMEELPDSVTRLCNLQTLDLHNCELKVIPDSISSLKNLRFLNLSSNPFEELPLSILTLSNLQTLDVNTCKNLRALPEHVAELANLEIFHFKNCPLLKALPEDFGALTQLRSLDLEGTGIKVLPESCASLNNIVFVHLFECQPPKDLKNWTKLRKIHFYGRGSTMSGVGKLAFLKELKYSVPKKLTNEPECNVGVQELRNLNFLEALGIGNLQNVKNPVDAERANLKGKQNLLGLVLDWDNIEEELGIRWWDQKSCNFQVFEALQPPTSLKMLQILNFMGCDLPAWMCIPHGLPELEYLDLIDCRRIKQLPTSIGQLPSLKRLELTGMSLKSLDIGGFPSLFELNLTDMFLLEEFPYSYPCLQGLRISGCKNLTEIPSFPSLMKLVLGKIDHKLVCSVGRSQTSLTKLFLGDIEELTLFPISILQNNYNLQLLLIEGCNQFKGFGVNDDDNENVVDMNGNKLYSSSLQHLEFNNCQVLEVLPDLRGLTSLQKLYFIDCPVLEVLPDLRACTSLQQLLIFNCPNVKESLSHGLKSLAFLKELYVDFLQRDEQRGDPTVYTDLINLLQ